MVDYEQSLFFLGPSSKTPEIRNARACALPLLNLKKKIDCSQSIREAAYTTLMAFEGSITYIFGHDKFLLLFVYILVTDFLTL